MYKTASIITPSAVIVNTDEMKQGLFFPSRVKIAGVDGSRPEIGPAEVSLRPVLFDDSVNPSFILWTFGRFPSNFAPESLKQST